MEKEFLHAGKVPWQCPNMLQLFGAQLRFYFLIGILFLWWRIEPKALGAFAFELELQPPHLSLRVEDVSTARSEKFGIGLVAYWDTA